MYTHSDKEQIDQLKRLWNSWGRWLVLALLAGGLVGFALQHWRAYKVKNDMAASSLFQNYLSAADADKNNILVELQDDYAVTPYPALASLLASRANALQGNWQKAADDLSWPIHHASMTSMRQVARLHLAQIFYQQKKYSKALKALAISDDNAYIAAVNNLRGDIYLAQGDKKAAQAAFFAAHTWLAAQGLPSPILDRQLAAFSVIDKK